MLSRWTHAYRLTGHIGRRSAGCEPPSDGNLGMLVDEEIADQGEMIGELHGRQLEAGHLDASAMQDEVEFLAGAVARVGGQSPGVGIAEARSLHEQVQFMVAPIGVEVA